MRFHIGRLPANREFEPERDGWTKCREPNFLAFVLLSIPIAIILVVLLVSTMSSIGEASPAFTMRPDDPASKFLLLLITLAGIFFSTIVLHEAAHVLGHPGMGMSPDTIVGVSPRHFVAFAAYDNEIGRNRFLFMLSLPLLLFSLAPIMAFAVLGTVNTWVAWIVILNGLGSCFDVLVAIIVIVQVPGNAVMRNRGWDTYWKRVDDNHT